MSLMSATSFSKTPIDYIAAGYWQDFLAKRPIAGGIAYEAELHDCQLDESLESLQRIDTLLSQIRRNMAKAGTWDEATVLADECYRNLLVFLAFYAGRVLARQWQSTPHWYSQFKLRTLYPNLPLIADDFYQHMAVSYNDDSVQAHNMQDKAVAPVFFALEAIGLRLFGNIDRQFEAVQGGQVPSGLYQAVSARLPNSPVDQISTASIPKATLNSSANVSLKETQPVALAKTIEPEFFNNIGPIAAPVASSKTTLPTTDSSSNSQASVTLKPVLSPTDNNRSVSTTRDAKTESHLPSNETQTKAVLSKNLSSPPSKTTVNPIAQPPTPEIFTRLLTELDEIEVTQTVGNSDYQQARKILDQFEKHIAKQNKPRAQVIFSESHQTVRQHGLALLQTAAALGNTAAMLRLAMYELLGEGLLTDNLPDEESGKEAGVDWVKQAASEKDIRAQRLLSRMYYQGIGVAQDINNGKYWLEQAAENGHLEAASLAGQWQQAQALITTRNQEQHSIKRYQLLIGVVIVAALLLIIFV